MMNFVCCLFCCLFCFFPNFVNWVVVQYIAPHTCEGATKYSIKTEKVKIESLNVPAIDLEIRSTKKQGYSRKRYRKPTKKELKLQIRNTKYNVVYSDGYKETDVIRTRLLAY